MQNTYNMYSSVYMWKYLRYHTNASYIICILRYFWCVCTKHDVKKHYVHLGVEPKIGGFYPPNHPFVHRVWNHYFHHPFWGEKKIPRFLVQHIFPVRFGGWGRGIRRWKTTKMDGENSGSKPLLKWMIWGYTVYPYFWKYPNRGICFWNGTGFKKVERDINNET